MFCIIQFGVGYEKKYYLIKDFNADKKICGQVLLELSNFVDFSARRVGENGEVCVHFFCDEKEVFVGVFCGGVIAKRLFFDYANSSKFGWVFETSCGVLVAGQIDDFSIERMLHEELISHTSLVYKQIAAEMFEGAKPCFFESIRKPFEAFLESAELVDFSAIFPNSRFGMVETDCMVHVVGQVFAYHGSDFVICLAEASSRQKSSLSSYKWKFFDSLTGKSIENTRIFGQKNGNYYSK